MKLLLSGLFIMIILYLLPDTANITPPCAPCGHIVRRAVDWKYQATEAGKLRLLKQSKEAFTRTDNHVIYLKNKDAFWTPSHAVFNTSGQLRLFFDGRRIYDEDFWQNYSSHYCFVDSVHCDDIGATGTFRGFESASTNQHFDQSQAQFPLNQPGSANITNDSPASKFSMTLKIYKGAALIDHSDFTMSNYVIDEFGNETGDISVNNIFGGLFSN